MQLHSEDTINRPVEEVYALVRDRLEELVPYLPNIAKITTESTDQGSSGLKKVNRWYAQVQAPGLIEKFLNPEVLSWVDRAQWDDATKSVRYSLEPAIGGNLFQATGHNSFSATDAGHTKLSISCDVEIHPEQLPGVPKLLAKKLTPAIEALIKKMLQPNLTALADGLREYYKAQN